MVTFALSNINEVHFSQVQTRMIRIPAYRTSTLHSHITPWISLSLCLRRHHIRIRSLNSLTSFMSWERSPISFGNYQTIVVSSSCSCGHSFRNIFSWSSTESRSTVMSSCAWRGLCSTSPGYHISSTSWSADIWRETSQVRSFLGTRSVSLDLLSVWPS